MTSPQDKLLQAKKLIDEVLKEIEDTNEKIIPPTERVDKNGAVDFSTNARAFFKQYARNLTGPKKFVLVLAYLAKGGETTHAIEEITALWGQVEGVMGSAYAGVYSTRAKEQDWVNSPENGVYVLRPTWPKIFD